MTQTRFGSIIRGYWLLAVGYWLLAVGYWFLGSSKEIELILVSGFVFFLGSLIRRAWRIRSSGCYFAQEGVELQFLIEFGKFLYIRFFLRQQVLIQGDRYIGPNRSEELRELDLLHLALHLGTQGSFDLVCMIQHVLNRAELLQ